MATSEQLKLIRIQVDAPGAKKEIKSIAEEMKQLSSNTKDIAGNFDLAKNALIGLATGRVITTFTGMADSMQLLNDRIKALLGSQAKATEAFANIREIAASTNSPISDIASTFARLTVSTQKLNLGVKATSELTEVLQNSFRLSGATAEEAQGSTIQFGQALSFGQLRGQELRSVLSQNAILAGVFGEVAAKAGKDVYKFAEAGGFTTKVILTALAEKMGSINASAKELGQTFGQTMIKAMNEVTISAGELNKNFDLNSKFAKTMQFILDHGSTIASLLMGIGAAFAYVKIQAALASGSMGVLASIGTALMGIPGLVALAVAGIGILIFNWEKVTSVLKPLGFAIREIFLDMEVGFSKGQLAVNKFFGGNTAIIEKNLVKLQELKVALQGEKGQYNIDQDVKSLRSEEDRKGYGSGVGGLLEKAKGLSNPIIAAREALKQLNEQYNEGTVSVEKYNAKSLDLVKIIEKATGPNKRAEIISKHEMENLTRLLDKGKISFDQFSESMDKLKIEQLEKKLHSGALTTFKFHEETRKIDLAKLGSQLEHGTMRLDEFDIKIKKIKMEELTEKLHAGKIATAEFVTEMNKVSEFSIPNSIYEGLDDYTKKIGNLSHNVSSVITGAFSKMEDALVNFNKTGRFVFREFAQAVLDDINRIIIRMMIIQPIAKGLMNFAAPSSGGSGPGPNEDFYGPAQAKGGAWMNGIQMFATGGVVSSPTMFGHAGGLGIMGEKGAEGILPLKRTPTGDLGVNASGMSSNVTVNVINQATDSEVTQTETTGKDGSRILDILIKSKVQETFANGGMDRTMSQMYGVQRRGN